MLFCTDKDKLLTSTVINYELSLRCEALPQAGFFLARKEGGIPDEAISSMVGIATLALLPRNDDSFKLSAYIPSPVTLR